MNQPWKMKPLDEWSIVGMHHYFVDGAQRLYVAMVKDDRCIKEEGPDDQYLWNRLWHQAVKIGNNRPLPQAKDIRGLFSADKVDMEEWAEYLRK